LEPVSNDKPTEHVAVECGRCLANVGAAVLGRAHEYIADDSSNIIEVLVGNCPKCRAVFVAGRWVDHWGGPDDYDLGPPFRIWPSPRRELSIDAPQRIREDFDEAQRCISVQAYNAAGMLARRVLEGIATDLGADAFKLGHKLEQLKKAGHLDGRLTDWAGALHLVGNDAAHDLTGTVSRDDAVDVLAFAEALADYVYTFRKRYEAFLQRRSVEESVDKN
jgi:hypothetical protein